MENWFVVLICYGVEVVYMNWLFVWVSDFCFDWRVCFYVCVFWFDVMIGVVFCDWFV